MKFPLIFLPKYERKARSLASPGHSVEIKDGVPRDLPPSIGIVPTRKKPFTSFSSIKI
jgi:hypothetical protein